MSIFTREETAFLHRALEAVMEEVEQDAHRSRMYRSVSLKTGKLTASSRKAEKRVNDEMASAVALKASIEEKLADTDKVACDFELLTNLRAFFLMMSEKCTTSLEHDFQVVIQEQLRTPSSFF